MPIKEKKIQHIIASIYFCCRLNAVAAVFASTLFTDVHPCFLNSSLCTRVMVGGSFTNWDFFSILLYNCEVQMYIDGYCCVCRKDLK